MFKRLRSLLLLAELLTGNIARTELSFPLPSRTQPEAATPQVLLMKLRDPKQFDMGLGSIWLSN